MLRIGKFPRLSGLSADTLYHYEDLRILVPASVDPSTGYRAYEAAQLLTVNKIMALKDAVQTVYQYSVTGGYEKSFDYRGVELFNQRGCLIISDVEQMVFDEAETIYATELWLLEDMSFAIVHCVKMKIGSEDTGYVTEYRAFKKPLEISEDLFFSPESLIEELESMCVPQWEHEATIYEL